VLATVTPTRSNKHCYRYNGQKEWCDLVKYGRSTRYRFFRVDYGGENGWVAGTLLNTATAASCPATSISSNSAGRGVCSYYGEESQGSSTANGERFDMNNMTAAHLSLPFGTKLRVTNEGNGRSVDVRINDRGPYVQGRVLDLSKGAFSKVEATSRGLFNCKYETIH